MNRMATRTSTANGWALEQDIPRQSRLKALLSDSALLRLLRYVPPHRKYAVLTSLFGTLGFLLSFLYPWIIGSAVDLVTGEHLQDLSIQSRYHRLVELTLLPKTFPLAKFRATGRYGPRFGRSRHDPTPAVFA